MRNPIAHIALGLLLLACQPKVAAPVQEAAPFSAHASVQGRADFAAKLQQQIIGKALATAPDSAGEAAWKGAFWGMGMSHTYSPAIRQGLERCLQVYAQRSPSFRRGLLEAIYTLDTASFIPQLKEVYATETQEKLVAMAGCYLQRAGESKGVLDFQLRHRFPAWAESPLLSQFMAGLRQEPAEAVKYRPSLPELLAHQRTHGRTVVYMLQRTDRNQPGLALLQRPDGSLLRDAEGKLRTFRFLARAASNLPAYLSNGNTPQGVFSLQQMGQSDNVFIGPTPTLITELPFEVPVERFFHTPAAAEGSAESWTMEHYLQLLPPSWQGYRPMQQAFWAGKAGRGEIIVHGSTIDPDFFRSEPYYPLTPSLGCMTALELWEDGKRGTSAQAELLQAVGEARGYLYLLELDNRPAPVSVQEVEHLLQAFTTN